MGYQTVEKIVMESAGLSETYFHTMMRLMGENPDVMELEADLGVCILGGGYKEMEETYPGQLFNCGIQEANMVGVACGLSAVGKVPFCHTFSPFLARRANDQIFISACYAGANIRLVGSDPGVTAAFNGATHMPFEDCALYMTIPNAVVIDSCDYVQTKALTEQLAKCGKPSYMRLIRKDCIQVYGDGSQFEIGKGVTLRDGGDVTIIASGILVDEALKAAELLESAQKINARVLDIHTWKPLDEALILKAASETGCIVTAENHQVSCGLGSAVANLLSQKCPIPLERIGIQDRFGQVGPQPFLMEQYNLTAKDIAAAAVETMSRRL